MDWTIQSNRIIPSVF